MQIIILNIVSTLLKMALLSMGNRYLSKWIAAGQYWFRNLTDEKLRDQVERDYNAYRDSWEKLKKDRKPFRPEKD